jgi:peptidoglycan glycosyltransferase
MQAELSPTPIRRVAMLLTIGFLLVALGAGYWPVIRGNELSKTVDTGRAIARAERTDRGRILAGDETTILVSSSFNDEGVAERQYHYPLLAPVTGVWAPSLLANLPPGLELSYNEWLSGESGPSISTALSQLMHEPAVGHDLITTIDMDLQQMADALLGDRAGAVVMIDPRNGDVLALASHPTYDPNSYREDAEQLVQSPRSPLLNRATQGLYTPGSVFKVVTLAGVLQQGLSRLDERFENPDGVEVIGGFPVRDNEVPPEAVYDLPHALAYSSNVTFAELGLRLGADGMRQIGKDFGFGEAPPFALETFASTLGSDETLLDQVGLANTAYGQGELLVTPMQMALVTGAIANAGVIPAPRLVREIRTREGAQIEEIAAASWQRALSRGVADQVREAMVISARDGYARAGAPQGIAIGGKTGTAQLGGNQAPHSWFIAFAPADAPSLAIAVMVENAGAGGDVAAPIARRLIEVAIGGQ